MFGSRDEFNSTDANARNRQMTNMRNKALSMLDPHLQHMVNSSNSQNPEHLTGLRARYDNGGDVNTNPTGQVTGQQVQANSNMMNNGPAVSTYTQDHSNSTQNSNPNPAISYQPNQPNLPKY